MSSVTAWISSGRARGGGAKSRPRRLLFCGEIDAAKQKNRYCLGDDNADTFTATIVVTAHPGRWSKKQLASFLGRHREFFIGGPPGKDGLLLEIVPDTLRKTKP